MPLRLFHVSEAARSLAALARPQTQSCQLGLTVSSPPVSSAGSRLGQIASHRGSRDSESRKDGRVQYESARDLPSFQELEAQLRALKVLSWLPWVDRGTVRELEAGMSQLIGTVDAFYGLLSDRHWIFHDAMNMEEMAAVVGLSDVDAAEAALIDYYRQPDTLHYMVLGLTSLEAFANRRHMIDAALADYQADRYYATVLVLLTVMDGFVNEFENVRRGLHARDAEDMSAWDSVVGHHKGLSHAHRTFTKTFSVTNADSITELYRNGIVHGTLTNFDNVVVATKAWNRLFAVADWARSRERASIPKEKPPRFREILKQLAENDVRKKANAAWTERKVTGTDALQREEIFTVTTDFAATWQRRNYAALAGFLPHNHHAMYGKKIVKEVKDDYEPYALGALRVLQLHYEAPAVCMVQAAAQINGTDTEVVLRWIREDGKGNPVAASLPGDWRLFLWRPFTMTAVPPAY
jgi:hypothetical protein